MSNSIYYVYLYLREKDSDISITGTPYYVGKGCDRRAFTKHQTGIAVPKDKNRIIFIAENLSEKEAHELEIITIKKYGRIDLGTGILRNKTDGGEGTSGSKHSEKTRKKMSKSMKGKHIGKKHFYDPITDHEIVCDPKDIISGYVHGRSNKFKKTHKHKKWYYNPISNEEILCLDENVPKNYVMGRSCKYIEKLTNSKKGKSFYHNPETNKELLCFANDVPTGYVKGRSTKFKKMLSNNTSGKLWYHNPETNKEVRCFMGENPNGFIIGKSPIKQR